MKKISGLGRVRLLSTISLLAVGFVLGTLTMSLLPQKIEKVLIRVPFSVFYGPVMTNKQFIKNLFRSGMVPMITQGAVDDFNEKYKKLGVKVTLQQVRKDRKLQEDVLLNYLDRYATEERLGHIPTPRDMARTLKGGPSGAKNNALVPYGNRIHDIVTSPRLLHPIG